LGAIGFEGELRGGGVREGLQEFKFEPDEFVGTALGDGHVAFAHLVVAGPFEDGAGSCRGTLKRIPDRRIEFSSGRPGLPVVEIVHLRKNSQGRGVDGCRPGDATVGRPHGNDDDKHDDDGCDCDEDFDEHDQFSPY
jgi:hypothetical protein